MAISIGIVGLPNVGKSTLFNAITQLSIQAENYPFCTIDPNIGTVPVPNDKLDILGQISNTQKTIYNTIKFIDIAGLVKGASQGEGLGNQFLSNIRETSVIAHVLRCFEDKNVTHVHETVDPIRDLEIINTELLLADMDSVDKWYNNFSKKAKSNNKEDIKRKAFLEKIKASLEQEIPIRKVTLTDEETPLLKEFPLLTAKKMVYVANVSESDLQTSSPHVQKLTEFLGENEELVIQLCTKLEAEVADLDEADKKDFLKEYGLEESGLDQLTKCGYDLLGLQTFITTGEKETRAWTIKQGATAPEAAGAIHTDFETGFIRANVLTFETFVECNGWKTAKEKGLLQQEGKEYIMKPDDIVEFLFNV